MAGRKTFPKHVEVLPWGTLYAPDRKYIEAETKGKVTACTRARDGGPRLLTVQCTSPDDSLLDKAIGIARDRIALNGPPPAPVAQNLPPPLPPGLQSQHDVLLLAEALPPLEEVVQALPSPVEVPAKNQPLEKYDWPANEQPPENYDWPANSQPPENYDWPANSQPPENHDWPASTWVPAPDTWWAKDYEGPYLEMLQPWWQTMAPTPWYDAWGHETWQDDEPVELQDAPLQRSEVIEMTGAVHTLNMTDAAKDSAEDFQDFLTPLHYNCSCHYQALCMRGNGKAL